MALSSDTDAASGLELVRRYFEALARHDLDAAVALWEPSGVDRIVGQQELVAPHGIRDYFGQLFHAFPDLRFEVIDTVAEGEYTTVRWRARGTFAGPGQFQAFEANGAQAQIEGCDVFTVRDGLIRHNEGYFDSGDVARQLGFLPPAGSPAETQLARLANLRTRLQKRLQGAEPERIADGVWIVRGGFPQRIMNVYLIEDEGGVTVFDAGIEDMVAPIRSAAAQLGGIRRVVLGHADADHRGAAPGLEAPVFCHPADREAAESPNALRTYMRFDRLEPPARWVIPRLMAVWDGGPVTIAGTVDEGDEIAGFRVSHLPGHAPGLIGLFREQDRLALVSDAIYTVDPQSGRKQPASVPHPAFNQDTERARGSIRKLAALNPVSVWAGHTDPVTGDVAAQLDHAATAPA